MSKVPDGPLSVPTCTFGLPTLSPAGSSPVNQSYGRKLARDDTSRRSTRSRRLNWNGQASSCPSREAGTRIRGTLGSSWRRELSRTRVGLWGTPSSGRWKDAAQALAGLQEEQVETQLAGRGDVTAPRAHDGRSKASNLFVLSASRAISAGTGAPRWRRTRNNPRDIILRSPSAAAEPSGRANRALQLR